MKPKFKYENLRSLSQVIDEGYWFFTWDLKSGYHHVDICKDHHQQHLGYLEKISVDISHFLFCLAAEVVPVIILLN